MFKICVHQFRQAFLSPRLYLALILGCAVQIICLFPLLEFSKALCEPLGIFEAFIYFNTDPYTAAGAFLGVALLVSDIPFSSQSETYTILRVSRKTWVAGKVLYLFGISAIYYLVLFIVSALFIAGNAFCANVWSLPFQAIVQQTAPDLFEKYSVGFKYRYLLDLSPAFACLISYLLSVCYVFVMSLFIFWFNLLTSKVLSYLAAILVHVVGYMLSTGFVTDSYQRFSLFANSLLMYHNFTGSQAEALYPTLPQSLLIFTVIGAALFLLILHAIRNYDFRITVGTKQ